MLHAGTTAEKFGVHSHSSAIPDLPAQEGGGGGKRSMYGGTASTDAEPQQDLMQFGGAEDALSAAKKAITGRALKLSSKFW
jgi:hypothetical protein